MRIGFVIPWFGMDIPGGAEAALRDLVLHLHAAGMDVEVLSTCVKEFTADWNKDFHKPGLTVEKGIPVRRFKVRKRDVRAFDEVNLKLMNNTMPLSDAEEETFNRENVNSTDLYDYIHDHQDEYDLFVYTPYMFGTTYYGIKACPQKAVMIPCFHEESYVHMRHARACYEQARGMIFLSHPEEKLARTIYDLSNVTGVTLGTGVYEVPDASAERFRQTYGIKDPFILYAGRKDAGKNVDVLIRYFAEYRRRRATDLKLVLIGGGSVDMPADQQDNIIDLGFLPVQDKYDAYRAALVLCQPSSHESFSLVVMESWLSDRPVLVSGRCDVTRDFATRAHGGLYFNNFYEFAGTMDWFVNHPEQTDQMGLNGHDFAHDNFNWDHIVEIYTAYFRDLVGHA